MEKIEACEVGRTPFRDAMVQGLTQEQVGGLIYVGAFYYEALLREENLIDDSKYTINGTVPYTTWEVYMLAAFGNLNVDEVATKLKRIKSATWDLLLLSKIIDPRTIDDPENLSLLRRYLPNAYIRSKATLLGTLTLSRNVSQFDAWRSSVLSGLSDDESNKVDPYLPEVFETAQELFRKMDRSLHKEISTKPQTHFTMNRNQRIALIVGAVLLVVMLLLPPWRLGSGRPGGYHFLFWPPDRNISIDFARLFLQSLFVGAVTAGGFLLLKPKRN